MDFFVSRYVTVGLLAALLLAAVAGMAAQGDLSLDLADAAVWAALSVAAGWLTFARLLPGLAVLNLRAGVTGKDIYKKGTPQFDEPIPESLGLAPAAAYFGVLLLLDGYFRYRAQATLQLVVAEGLAYIVLATFLGFVDDMLELRWRDKLIYPFFFSIAAVMSYRGEYRVRFPPAIEAYLGIAGIPLGLLYPVYLVCLSIFCVNSINIYAGISGLESGQSLVAGMTLMLENVCCIARGEKPEASLRSLLVLGPFCAVSLPLLVANRPERKTFVGDTYVYFAGCVLAYASMVGEFPVKVLFFLLPQVFNFLLSLPQLVGIVPCPRHRLPQAVGDGTLRGTFPQNLNNINLVLWLAGPMSERKLGSLLIAGQAAFNLAVIAVSALCSAAPVSRLKV